MKRIALFAYALIIVLTSAAQGQRANVSGGWITTTSTNPMDSVRTVTALKDSVEQPASSLVIRCKGQHADVYVKTSEVVSPEYGVRVKFDQGRASKQSWRSSTGYDALFSPAAGDFLRNLKVAKLLYFEYTPYGKAESVVSFEVSGLPEEMYAACVTSEIEKAEVRAKKAAAERARAEKRQSALRVKCAPFTDESVEKVERAESPLPPQECWEILPWTGSATYDEVVKRRGLCKLPSFARDPAYCGKPQESAGSKDSGSNEQH